MSLITAPGSRVVNVSSMGLRAGRIRFDDLQSERSYNRVSVYGQSKLANLLFTYELQRKLAGGDTIAVAAHPGGSSSELSRHLPGRRAAGLPAPRTRHRDGRTADPACGHRHPPSPAPSTSARVA